MKGVVFRGGESLDREDAVIERLVERFGYTIHFEDGLLVAERPRVIEKVEFVDAVEDVDTRHYGSLAWSSLRSLYWHRELRIMYAHNRYPQEILDAPVRFIRSGYSGGTMEGDLLAIDTLPPTIEWIEGHPELLGHYSMHRTLQAWEQVAEQYAHQNINEV